MPDYRDCSSDNSIPCTRRALEESEEAERARREGSAYKPRAVREAEARERAKRFAADADEARGLRNNAFDPTKNYYAILNVDRLASTAEIRKAYKRLALTCHPDKVRCTDPEALEALAQQFKAMVEAYDVLCDEATRSSYDRVRAQLQAGGGQGSLSGKALTPEEAAAMMKGMRELARLRREGMRRSAKHAPLAAEIRVSLEKLHRGCTKRCTVTRTTLDSSGVVFEEQKTFHVVVRKGSADGTRYVLESCGSETCDLLPGDVVITLREKPHRLYRRSGAKDLLRMAAPQHESDLLFCEACQTLAGRHIVLVASPLMPSLCSGGQGGFTDHVFPGEGMPDPRDPWEHPPGALVIRLRHSPRSLERGTINTPVRPGLVFLLGSSDAVLPAAAVGGAMASATAARTTASDLAAVQHGWRDPTACAPPPPVCLLVDVQQPSAACRALMDACHCGRRRWTVVTVNSRDEAAAMLLDDEVAALEAAPCVVVDYDGGSGAPSQPSTTLEHGIRDTCSRLATAGIAPALWAATLRGACIAGIADGVALLGLAPPLPSGQQAPQRTVLPLVVRTGGGAAGWAALHHAMATWPRGGSGGEVQGVGVLPASAIVVHPSVWWKEEGAAELLVSPPREVLAATALAVGTCGEAHRYDDDLACEPDLGFPERTTPALALARAGGWVPA